jgi:hypothetical protein
VFEILPIFNMSEKGGRPPCLTPPEVIGHVVALSNIYIKS